MFLFATLACGTDAGLTDGLAEATLVEPLVVLEHETGELHFIELGPGSIAYGEIVEHGGRLLTIDVLQFSPVQIWRSVAPDLEVPEELFAAVERARSPETGELPWDEDQKLAIGYGGLFASGTCDTMTNAAVTAQWFHDDVTDDSWEELEDVDFVLSSVCPSNGTVAHRLWTKNWWFSDWVKAWDVDVTPSHESWYFGHNGPFDFDHIWTGVYDVSDNGWNGETADFGGFFDDF